MSAICGKFTGQTPGHISVSGIQSGIHFMMQNVSSVPKSQSIWRLGTA